MPKVKLAIAIAAAATALAGCASTSSSAPASSLAAAEANPNLDLGTALGGQAAPDFTLTNSSGGAMSLSQFRGKVVLLAFADSECTNLCPLTTQSMIWAKQLLGKAGDQVQLLGVDANPRAVSTSDLLTYSRDHGMVNKWNFLTGSLPQLKKVWTDYHIAVQIEHGDIDHTPALFVIDSQGKLRKLYLTSMAFASVGQAAQVLAQEISGLLPGHPMLSSVKSLAQVPVQSPTMRVSLPSPAGGKVQLGPGKARLVTFFGSWVPGVKGQLVALNAVAKDPRIDVVAVDEAVTEPVNAPVRAVTAGLSYPVGVDESGRVADGYGVQDQPWLVLINAAGKIVWSHDGWLPVSEVMKAAASKLGS